MRVDKFDKEQVIGFVMVKIDPVARIIPVYRSLRGMEGIVEMHEITGEFDLIIKVVAKDIEQLRTVVNQIRSKEGIRGLETIISYHKVV